MSANGGGPAFPSGEKYRTTDLAGCTRDHAKAPFYAGLSLRDYFAAAALKGILARPVSETEGYGVAQTDLIAAAAFRHADAMLAERERKP